jgi:hypothetical protein
MKLTLDLWERHLAATLSWLEATPTEAAFYSYSKEGAARRNLIATKPSMLRCKTLHNLPPKR